MTEFIKYDQIDKDASGNLPPSYFNAKIGRRLTPFIP